MRAQDNIIKQWKLEFNLPLRQGFLTKESAYGSKQSVKKQPEKKKEGLQDSPNSVMMIDEESLYNYNDNNESQSSNFLWFNEVHRLAQGVKWFGIGQNELHNLKKEYLEYIEKNNLIKNKDKDFPSPLKTLVENQEILEKTVLMSQFSRWN